MINWKIVIIEIDKLNLENLNYKNYMIVINDYKLFLSC